MAVPGAYGTGADLGFFSNKEKDAIAYVASINAHIIISRIDNMRAASVNPANMHNMTGRATEFFDSFNIQIVYKMAKARYGRRSVAEIPKDDFLISTHPNKAAENISHADMMVSIAAFLDDIMKMTVDMTVQEKIAISGAPYASKGEYILKSAKQEYTCKAKPSTNKL